MKDMLAELLRRLLPTAASCGDQSTRGSYSRYLVLFVSIAFCGCSMIEQPYWREDTEVVRSTYEQKTHYLQVTSEPVGAKVFLEDQQVGVTPCNLSFPYRERVNYAQRFNEYWEFVYGRGVTVTKRQPLGGVHEHNRYVESSDKTQCTLVFYKPGYERINKRVTVPDVGHINVFLKREQPRRETRASQQQQQQQQQQTVIVGEGRNVQVAEKGYVTIESIPDGAEVQIDGGFVGNAPIESAQLSVGQHRITVIMTGYRTWERNIMVLSSSRIRVVATLEE